VACPWCQIASENLDQTRSRVNRSMPLPGATWFGEINEDLGGAKGDEKSVAVEVLKCVDEMGQCGC
jgi:hypothetical protein